MCFDFALRYLKENGIPHGRLGTYVDILLATGDDILERKIALSKKKFEFGDKETLLCEFSRYLLDYSNTNILY